MFNQFYFKSLVVIQCKDYIAQILYRTLQEVGMLSLSFLYMAEPAHQRLPSLNTVQTTHTVFAQKHSGEA